MPQKELWQQKPNPEGSKLKRKTQSMKTVRKPTASSRLALWGALLPGLMPILFVARPVEGQITLESGLDQIRQSALAKQIRPGFDTNGNFVEDLAEANPGDSLVYGLPGLSRNVLLSELPPSTRIEGQGQYLNWFWVADLTRDQAIVLLR